MVSQVKHEMQIFEILEKNLVFKYFITFSLFYN